MLLVRGNGAVKLLRQTLDTEQFQSVHAANYENLFTRYRNKKHHIQYCTLYSRTVEQ
jgi:hypothetical protein